MEQQGHPVRVGDGLALLVLRVQHLVRRGASVDGNKPWAIEKRQDV